MEFRVGDKANGRETSERIIEADDYLSVLEELVETANLYCKPKDKEAKDCCDKINDFRRERNRLLFGWDK